MKSADLIVHNGTVITLDNESRVYEAIAVSGERISAVGTNEEVLGYRGQGSRIINARGRAVIPGLTDGHAHMDREALKGYSLSLSQVKSIRELKLTIADAVSDLPDGAWVIAGPIGKPPSYAGAVEAYLSDGRAPTRHDLDDVAPLNPVYIRAPWGYWRPAADNSPLTSIANTEALRRSGIDKATVPPVSDIIIERDNQGEPTGVFREAGPVLAVEITLMSPECWFSHADRSNSVEASMDAYASVATTAVFEGHGVSPDIIRAHSQVYEHGLRKVRSHLVVGPVWSSMSGDSIRDAMNNWYAWAAGQGLGDSWMRVAGLFGKMGRSECDNVLSAYKHYSGWAGYTHDSAMPPNLFREFVIEAARLGLRVTTLFPDALDAFEEANRIRSIGDLRWVIGHVGTLTPDQINRIRDLGVVLTLHTNRSIADMGVALATRLGPERESEIVPARALIDAGVPFSLSSDNNPISLFKPIWHCVARLHAETGRRIAPDQALSREEALRVAAQGGAWLTFDENRRGELALGKLADFSILSDDPLSCPEHLLPDISSIVTVVGGNVMSF